MREDPAEPAPPRPVPAEDRRFFPAMAALVELCRSAPRSGRTARACVDAWTRICLDFEAAAFDRTGTEDPDVTATRLLEAGRSRLAETLATSGATPTDGDDPVSRIDETGEDLHRAVFQDLWNEFDAAATVERVRRFQRRLAANGLDGDFLGGKSCVDFGCGHGAFALALLEEGAADVTAFDYGAHNVRLAERARDVLGYAPDRLRLAVANVYDCGSPDAAFDFAVQNGVFHHLDDPERAYREVHRVLRPDGLFWVYTDGSGGALHHLRDAARLSLDWVPLDVVLEHLRSLGLETGKRYHLGDCFKAVYRHGTWEETTAMLARCGFADFRRLVGGLPTDLDHDVVAADPHGVAKFGCGDLRLLCRKPA